jgi:hypothetical protein
MEAHWGRSLPNENELELFDGSQVTMDAITFIISRCIFNKDSRRLLEIPTGVSELDFREVIFQDSFQFKFSEIENISLHNCRLKSDGYFYQEKCEWSISHSVLEGFNRVHLFREGLTIRCSTIGALEIGQSELSRVQISNTCLESLVVQKAWFILDEINVSKSTRLNHFEFSGFVHNQLLLGDGVCFNQVSIKCERLEEGLLDYGQIVIEGISVSGAIVIQPNPELNIEKEEEKLNRLYLERLHVNFDRLDTSKLVIANVNATKLGLVGRNNNVSVFVRQCNFDEIYLDGYSHTGSAYVVLRDVPRSLSRGSNYGNKLVISKSIFSNNEFYFQNCEMKNWFRSVDGSRFLFQSLSSSMPEKDFDTSIQSKLDAVNTFLLNTDRDSDVLNYQDLKKQQWKLLWKKKIKENKIHNWEYLQWLAQLSNDYGTDWWRPMWILIVSNVVFTCLAIVFNPQLDISNLGFCGLFWEELYQNIIIPFKFLNPSEVYYHPIFKFFKTIINGILIFQIISAFRVYFKK